MLGTADEVPSDQWRTRPNDGGWSAAEIIAHLIMVERSVVGKADRVVQHPPRKFSRLQKLHFPLALVEARLVRRKAPMPVDPEMIGEKETMLAELREIRERLLAFIDETKERNLGMYRWQHPFLGSLSTYEWFEMVARHELRHVKQMREIAGSYRKP
jgi:DinB superfamily